MHLHGTAAGGFAGVHLPLPCLGAGALDLLDLCACGAGAGICDVQEEVLLPA